MNNIKTGKWNNVIILSSTQALFQTGSILVATLSGLVGLKLAPNEGLATLPISVISLGTASMMVPASLIIRKVGQRFGFMIGTIFGLLAGLLSFYAIMNNSFPLFIAGNILLGCSQGFSQYYRFAAADSVSAENKGKAISFVMAAGVVAAIAGPGLAKYTQNIGKVAFAYSFLSLAILSVLAMLVISFLRIKRSSNSGNETSKKQGRPLDQIIGQRDTITALIASAIGYSVMIMVMTATPIAMHHCGHTSSDSATVIQWHVLGMFVPSFFTGSLIKKFGVHKIILSGIFILFLHVALALTGTDFMNFISGLILLGVGWNFMYIGGSTLLTTVYQPEEKEKTQAFHDFLVFAIISTSSFSAGGLLKYWGWEGVNMAVLPLLIFAAIAIPLLKNTQPVKERVEQV